MRVEKLRPATGRDFPEIPDFFSFSGIFPSRPRCVRAFNINNKLIAIAIIAYWLIAYRLIVIANSDADSELLLQKLSDRNFYGIAGIFGRDTGFFKSRIPNYVPDFLTLRLRFTDGLSARLWWVSRVSSFIGGLF